MALHSVRIFVSSPSDVQPERERVDRAVERLQHDYKDLIDLEIFRWEETYYTARGGFQQQIESRQSPRDADLVICILWKRLGSTLPEEFNRPDGTPRTGTEYEFETAMEKALKEDIPDILLYRKKAEILFHSDRVDQEKAELQALNAFWGQWVRNEEGHFIAGFKGFEDAEEFEALLESDLRAWIQRRYKTASWPESKGAPYRGLEVFYAEHADIFFGRNRAIKEIRAKLLAQSEKGKCGFLMIVGASGSGKSSIVRAGLLEALRSRQPIPGVTEWRYCAVRPSELGRDLLQGLAQSMSSDGVLAEILEGDCTTPDMLCELWRSAPKLARQPVSSGLSRIARALQAADGLKNLPGVQLLLLVDQLEELFQYPASERDLFLDVIENLAYSPDVWVVTTLRSDLYGELQTVPGLMELKSAGVQYDLLPPREHELREIITAPAAMAGLAFEQAEDGSGLDERLLDEAKEAPGALPLLEYTLSQLYDARDRERKVLTIAAYERMGGLRGAIGQKAEATLGRLPEAVQKSLTRVLLTLVTISNEGKVSARVQAYAQYEEGSPERQLVDAFMAKGARLITTQEDSNYQPVIRVSHEALLTHWQRARTIIEENRQDIELRAVLEQEAARWEQAEPQHKAGYLRQAGKALEEARDLLRRKSGDLGAGVRDYIQKSIDEVERRARRRVRIIRALGAGAAMLLLVMGVSTWFAFLGQTEARKSQAELLLTSSIYQVDRGNSAAAAESLIESIELDPENPIAVARLTSLLTQRSYPLLRSEIRLFDSKVWKIIKSPDERRLVVLSQRGEASLIDIGKREKWTGFLESETVDDIAFSADGNKMAVKTGQGRVQIWDVEHRQKLHTLEDLPGKGALAISANGRFVLGRRLWEISGDEVIERDPTPVQQELISAQFLRRDTALLTVARSGLIEILPLVNGRQSSEKISLNHGSIIRTSTLSQDGRRLATSGDDQLVKVWDLGSGELLRELAVNEQITGMIFDRERLHVATLSGTVSTWDVGNGIFIGEEAIHRGAITDLAISENRLLTASWDGTATISGGEEPLLEPMRHPATVYSIAPSANSREVYTGSVDGILRHWEYLPPDFRFDRFRARKAIDLLAYDDLFEVIAVVSGKGKILEIYNRAGNTSVDFNTAHAILHVGVSPDGRLVRWITSAGEIYTVEADAESLDDIKPEILRRKPLRVEDTGDWARIALQFAPRQLRLWNSDGNFPMSLGMQTKSPIRFVLAMPEAGLVGAIQADNRMNFWDLKTGLAYETPVELPVGVDMARPEARRVYLVSGKNIHAFEIQNQFRLRGPSPELTLIGVMAHEEDIVTMDVSDDGLSLVSSSLDGSLRVWDTTSFAQELFVNLGNPAYTVDISPNGRWLLAGSQDGNILTIDLGQGTPVADSFRHADSVVLAHFDKLGNQVASASADGSIRLAETSLHLRLPSPRWLPALARRVVGIESEADAAFGEIPADERWVAWKNSLGRRFSGETQ